MIIAINVQWEAIANIIRLSFPEMTGRPFLVRP